MFKCKNKNECRTIFIVYETTTEIIKSSFRQFECKYGLIDGNILMEAHSYTYDSENDSYMIHFYHFYYQFSNFTIPKKPQESNFKSIIDAQNDHYLPVFIVHCKF